MTDESRTLEELLRENERLRARVAEAEVLAESERRHRSLFESAADAILVMEGDRVTDCNPRALETFGCTRAQMLAQRVPPFSPEHQPDGKGSREQGRERLGRAMRGERQVFDWRHEHADGTPFDAEISLNRLEGLGSERLLAIVRDVTETRRVERELREKETREALVLRSLPMVFYVAEPSGEFGGAWVSEQVEEITGFPAERFTRDLSLWSTRIHPDDRTRTLEAFERLRHEESVEVEYRWQAADERYRWFRDCGVLRRDAQGEPESIVGTWMDITERKQAEKELQQTRALLLAAIEQSPAGILIADAPDVRIRLANSAALGIRGGSELALTDIPAELHPQRWQTSYPDGTPYRPKDLPLSRAVLRGETARNVEVVIQRTDGEKRWVLGNAAPVRNAEGEIVAGVVVFPDITDWKQAEQERARLATAIEQVAESILVTDSKGAIQYVNPAFETDTGYTHDEVLGQSPALLKSTKHDDAFYRKLWATISEGGVWKGRFFSKKKDGTPIEAQATISPIRDAAGEIINYVAVGRDVTHERELERRLRQAQKMEAIGTLAGGIAHDFNNILVAILGYTEMSLMELSDELHSREYLQQVRQACERARSLVSQILAFSRRSEQENAPIQLAIVAKEALKLLRATLPATIEIRQQIEADGGEVLGDPTQMHQVLMNLATNAAHAMRDKGGVLDVRLDGMELDARSASSYPTLRPGRYARLRVSDTGVGMDRTTLERIFEPYFTTKEKGEGTGLGLTVVQAIVNNSGGTITAESTPDTGTTFQVLLPLAEQHAEPEFLAGEEELPRGSEHILLVDDEPMALALWREALGRLGYRVTTEVNGHDALARFQEQPDAFHLVITDMTMPRMTGATLARELLAIRPRLPIILCTGFSEQIDERGAQEMGIRTYLRKPVKVAEMAGAVRRTLAGET